jgi:hypothetical protein
MMIVRLAETVGEGLLGAKGMHTWSYSEREATNMTAVTSGIRGETQGWIKVKSAFKSEKETPTAETVNPFFSLVALAPDVVHNKRGVFDCVAVLAIKNTSTRNEILGSQPSTFFSDFGANLNDTTRDHSCMENVIRRRKIFEICNFINFAHKIFEAIVNL